MDNVEFRIWGKSKGLNATYPLIAHLVDTAAVAYTLLKTHLPSSTLKALAIDRTDDNQIREFAFLAGLHDFGKITPTFQGKDSNAKNALNQLGFSFPSGKPLPHDQATQLLLPEAFEKLSSLDITRKPLDGILGKACMLGGHHGIFYQLRPAELYSNQTKLLHSREPQLGIDYWCEQRAAHFCMLAKATSIPINSLDNFLDNLNYHKLVLGAGVIIIADWLASQSIVVGSSEDWPAWENIDWTDWFKKKAAWGSDLAKYTGISAPKVSRKSFTNIFNVRPRPLQESLENFFNQNKVSSGILLITAPMGVGKTEAALLASQRMGAEDNGLLFLLPTMATADAMFDRVVNYARHVISEKAFEVSLVHSMASLNQSFIDLPYNLDDILSEDTETIAIASQWLRGHRKTLLAPIVAATIDQLIAVALKSRRGFLRWLSISGKTIIVDEAHSFDAYMHGLLCTTLAWLGKFDIPVIIMSATLPRRIATEMIEAWCEGAGIAIKNFEKHCPYPGWLFVGNDGTIHSDKVTSTSTTVAVRVSKIPNWEEVWVSHVEQSLTPLIKDGCALVVCNTISDAQKLTAHLTPWAARHEIEVICLHSRFRQADRRRLTQDILFKFGVDGLARPKKAVLIATQIAEQSLDVDFDLIITCLAPVAALLQRAGRGHRHIRLSRPKDLMTPTLEVLVPTDYNGNLSIPNAWKFIYPFIYIKRTWEEALLYGDVHKWDLPGDVEKLINAVYGQLADTDEDLLQQYDREWLDKLRNPHARIPEPAAMGSLSDLTVNYDEDDLDLATRLGISSIQVVCLWEHASGLYLDKNCTIPMPELKSPDNTRLILDSAIPLNRETRVTRAIKAKSIPHENWDNDPWLSDAAVIILDHQTSTTDIDGWRINLDPLIGLSWENT